jgi:cytochrome c oxidase subunit 2
VDLRPPRAAGIVCGVVEQPASSVRPRLRTALVGLVLGGCAWDTPMSTLEPRSDVARAILDIYALITWAEVGIAAVVCAALIWVLVRYRARPGAPTPRQVRGHTLLEIAWTIAPALVLLVIAIPTIQVIFRTQGVAAPPQALEVVVRGYQWWWEFRYPSLDVVTANELHLPEGRPVVLRLEGPDVIHSFWVPRLGGKRDVIPGRLNQIVLTPEAVGQYVGHCAEFCGASHALMGMRVFVEPPDAFERWVAAQRAPATEPPEAVSAGRDLYARSACVGCHTIRGVSAGALGPDLTRFGSRTTLAAGMFPNTLENLTAWLLDPPAIKPGVKMPPLGLGEEQARAIAAYLLSLK